MKKKYISPEMDIIKLMLAPVLLDPSTYDPDPQVPTRAGDDDPDPTGDL